MESLSPFYLHNAMVFYVEEREIKSTYLFKSVFLPQGCRIFDSLRREIYKL